MTLASLERESRLGTALAALVGPAAGIAAKIAACTCAFPVDGPPRRPRGRAEESWVRKPHDICLDGVRVGEEDLLEHPRTAGLPGHVVLQPQHLQSAAVA